MKLFDFFFKKEIYKDCLGFHQTRTPFMRWFENNWIYSVYCQITRLSEFNFKYDVLYKRVYLKLQKYLAIPYDCWSLDYTLVDYLIPRILWLKDNKNGINQISIQECVEKGLVTNKYRHLAEDDWKTVYQYQQEVLFDIAKGLACFHLLDKTINPERIKMYEERVDEAFDMIKRYRGLLWD